MSTTVRHALRQLRRNPGFTAVAILTLALGIGANTAIFSVMDRLLVRPLPVPAPHQLALVGAPLANGHTEFHFNYPLYLDYRRENPVFRELAATGDLHVGLSAGGTTERQRAMVVSGNYFKMLGLNAALGRTFADHEGVEIDDATVVVLGHGLWVRRFGADPGVIGRSVTVNGRPFTVIGVAPREFAGTTRSLDPDLYLPLTAYGLLAGPLQNGHHPLRTRFFTWLNLIGRLHDGVSHAEAQAGLQVVTDRFNQEAPPNTPERIAVLPGAQGFTQDLRDARLPLRLLLATAGLVLLIACANLANLQLARATSRSRDFAIRLALGARRGRLIRALLAESLLIALAGGLLGLWVAYGLVTVLAQFRPPDAQIEIAASLDGRMLAFALAASLVTGLLFGLVPALRSSRPNLLPELKGIGASRDTRLGRWNLRGALVVFQVALSLLVLVSAGLCARSLWNLQQHHPARDPSQIVLLSFDLGLNNYGESRAREFQERLLERARAVPGVEAASLALTTPLSGRSPRMSIEGIEGVPAAPLQPPVAEFNVVTPDYFRALGVPVLKGREFQATDTAQSHPVVIINEAFAQRFLPDQEPVGRRLVQHGPNGGIPTEIIGVVQATPARALTDAPSPAFFFAATQKPVGARTLVVRTGIEPAATLAHLQQVVRSLDPDVPIFGMRTLAQQKSGSLALQRMAATLLGGFGGLALLLATLGIYGVLAYSVSRRTREIGIRMALGAQIPDVLTLVMRQGLGLAGLGLVLGLAGAWAVTRLLRGFLHQVQPLDPPTYLAVMTVLAGVALLAGWLPARRAARVNPVDALRSE